MTNFWDFNNWKFLVEIAVLLLGVLVGNILRRSIKLFRKSLIPNAVLGGIAVLIFNIIVKQVTGESFFNTANLEMITYHCLGLGFAAMGLKKGDKSKQKHKGDVLTTGATTVGTYLIQGILGLVITIVLSLAIPELLPASGILLCLGFGQGTGQALNWGRTYENIYGFAGGASFGLTLAAFGFLVACVVGVIYMNILKKQGKIKIATEDEIAKNEAKEVFFSANEPPMSESCDKLTMQFGLVFSAYLLAFLFMFGITKILDIFNLDFFNNTVKPIIWGFNFLFSILSALLIKGILGFMQKKNLVHREYINNFSMNRIGGFTFDLMVTAGIVAIEIALLKKYWYVIALLVGLGSIITLFYLRLITKKNFEGYNYEAFFAMFGMLTGTASTGVILLREIDPEFKTPAADNLVFQNLPAIILGFPIMLLVGFAPKGLTQAIITLAISIGLFLVINVLIFRKQIFKKKVKK